MTRLAPSAVEGLRPCLGGGFALPGSAACLRLSGSITTQTTLRSGTGADAGRARLFSSGVQGRLAADIRVPTEAGPLRAYLSLRGRTGRFTDGAGP